MLSIQKAINLPIMTMISKVKPLVSEKADWFEDWFNSPYYHILYKKRDELEAEVFIDALLKFIQPNSGSRVLDVACGKGRHSIYLSRKGFDVTGFDLSFESIRHNKKFENEKLTFYLHDMREVFRSNYFDLVLNLFSSFGYFEKERDNIRCINSHATALKKGGIFVLDYFNAKKVIHTGDSSSNIVIDGINFLIEKSIQNDFVRKKITFSDKGHSLFFEENLLLAEKKIIDKYFNIAGLEVYKLFGSYELEPFDEKNSERLIVLAKKI